MEILQRYKIYLCGEYTSKHTKADYYSHVKQFLTITKGILDSDTIIIYKAYLNQKYKNKNTRNKKIIAVNQFLKWYNRTDLLLKNIGWDKEIIRPTLKDHEISKLLEKAYSNPELYLITLLLFEGCLRDGNIINIKIKDRAGNKLYLNQTKTGPKYIMLSPRLREAWDNYLSIRPTPKKEHEEYLFIDSYKCNKGKKWETIKPIIRRISHLGKQIKLGIPITPYTLRRTSATLRQDKFSEFFAGDVKIVQRMFNHQDIRTTLRYDHRTDHDVEKYLESLYNNDESGYKRKKPSYNVGLYSFFKTQ